MLKTKARVANRSGSDIRGAATDDRAQRNERKQFHVAHDGHPLAPELDLGALPSGSNRARVVAIQPRPVPKSIRVHELATEIHLDILGVQALAEAVGDVLDTITPVVLLAGGKRTNLGRSG